MNDRQSLIEFPCIFPIKIMGEAHVTFPDTVLKIIQQHDPNASHQKMHVKHSANKSYMSITVQVYAESKNQLDAIYLALTNHHLVKVVL